MGHDAGSVCATVIQVDREFRPAGYNIGINDGAAAGQTVPHLYIHLIPRYAGDRDDVDRGGRVELRARRARAPGCDAES